LVRFLPFALRLGLGNPLAHLVEDEEFIHIDGWHQDLDSLARPRVHVLELVLTQDVPLPLKLSIIGLFVVLFGPLRLCGTLESYWSNILTEVLL